MKNMNKNTSILMRTLVLSLLLSLVGCASHTVSSPQADSVDDKSTLSMFVKGDKAYLSGVLGTDLVEQLKTLLQNHPNVTELVLVDIPGTDDEEATMEGARLIRSLGLNTRIARTGYVLSGGVDFFLGGVKRTIGSGAGVGIHTWTDESGKKPTSREVNDSINATYVDFYLSMGIPGRFYWFSLKAAPADRVYFLSPEEMYDYQLITE